MIFNEVCAMRRPVGDGHQTQDSWPVEDSEDKEFGELYNDIQDLISRFRQVHESNQDRRNLSDTQAQIYPIVTSLSRNHREGSENDGTFGGAFVRSVANGGSSDGSRNSGGGSSSSSSSSGSSSSSSGSSDSSNSGSSSGGSSSGNNSSNSNGESQGIHEQSVHANGSGSEQGEESDDQSDSDGGNNNSNDDNAGNSGEESEDEDNDGGEEFVNDGGEHDDEEEEDDDENENENDDNDDEEEDDDEEDDDDDDDDDDEEEDDEEFVESEDVEADEEDAYRSIPLNLNMARTNHSASTTRQRFYARNRQSQQSAGRSGLRNAVSADANSSSEEENVFDRYSSERITINSSGAVHLTYVTSSDEDSGDDGKRHFGRFRVLSKSNGRTSMSSLNDGILEKRINQLFVPQSFSDVSSSSMSINHEISDTDCGDLAYFLSKTDIAAETQRANINRRNHYSNSSGESSHLMGSSELPAWEFLGPPTHHERDEEGSSDSRSQSLLALPDTALSIGVFSRTQSSRPMLHANSSTSNTDRAASIQRNRASTATHVNQTFDGHLYEPVSPRDFQRGGSRYGNWQRVIRHLSLHPTSLPSESLESNPGKSCLCQSWRPSKRPDLIIVKANRRTISYVGHGLPIPGAIPEEGNLFPATLYSRYPLSVCANENVEYFEAKIQADQYCCGIQVGFVFGSVPSSDSETSALQALKNGIAYVARDGRVYEFGRRDPSTNSQCTYGNNDVIGCGVNRSTNDIFFTKNGILVFTIPFSGTYRSSKVGFDEPFYPSVTLTYSGEEVQTNFGPDFIYDVHSLIAEGKARQIAEIEDYPRQESVVSSLIHEYLEFSGFEKTLRAFEEESAVRGQTPNSSTKQNGAKDTNIGNKVQPTGNVEPTIPIDEDVSRGLQGVLPSDVINQATARETDLRALHVIFSPTYLSLCNPPHGTWVQSNSDAPLASLSKRALIRKLILAQQPLIAANKLERWYPVSALKKLRSDGTLESMRAQHFVELCAVGKTAEAVQFAKKELLASTASKLIPLVAYRNLSDSPYRSLLTRDHRVTVADHVNRAMIMLQIDVSTIRPISQKRENLGKVASGKIQIEELQDDSNSDNDGETCYEDITDVPISSSNDADASGDAIQDSLPKGGSKVGSDEVRTQSNAKRTVNGNGVSRDEDAGTACARLPRAALETVLAQLVLTKSLLPAPF